MIAYKGFWKTDDGKLMCREMEYEVGRKYEHEGRIWLCHRGFHACHELHQVWLFYPNDGNNVFYEVECGGDVIESNNGDGKLVCSEITLVKEVDVSDVEKFDEIFGFSDGFYLIFLDRKCNFINTKGNLLSKQWFDYASSFSEGFARVEINGKLNLINTEGSMLSEQWFDALYAFSEGFAQVKINGKWNFINTEGKLLSERWFDEACYFSDGFARVNLDDKWNLVNKKGEFAFDKWFYYCSRIDEQGMATVLHHGKFVNIDMSGNIIS